MAEEKEVNKRRKAVDRRGVSQLELEMIRLGDRLDNHEKVCTERYNKIEEAISWALKILVSGGGSLIIGMASILGYLIFHAK